MSGRLDNDDARQHAAAVDFSLRELQKKVAEHEAELERIRSSQDQVLPSVHDQTRLLTYAFDELNESEPFLPAPNSILPALLAMRRTLLTIEESREYLSEQEAPSAALRRQLENDQANLKDQNLLAEALEARLKSLQTELGASDNLVPEDTAKERIEELKTKKRFYKTETQKLMGSLTQFVNEHLASSLAAEELGGPVVGDLMEIDANDLAAGFSSQGTLKKVNGKADDGKRQRRLDELWGHLAAEDGQEYSDEASAAAAEMTELTENLLNQLVEAKGDTSASYVTLPRESAAARFLVRSQVAQFHPKDAKRLRLVDFGRTFES